MLAENLMPRQALPPLAVAAGHGDVLSIVRLLKQRVDINEEDKDGWTALAYAAAMNQREAFKALMRHGAQLQSFHPLAHQAILKMLKQIWPDHSRLKQSI